jgi:tRNA-2-methylthio-N6-dimethylallyladenosine synthase
MKYFIKTFGCQMNFSDSERMKTFFEAHKMQELPEQCSDQNALEKKLSLVKNMAKADLVVFNTCGVRQSAEDRVLGLVYKLHHKNPTTTIVITGCLAHRPDVQKKLSGMVDLYLPIKDFPQIFTLLKNQKNNPALNKAYTSELKIIHSEQHKKEACKPQNDYLKIAPTYKYTDIAFVPIMTGCNNFCSYCVVPYARGREWSRPIEDIFKEIEILSKNGCKEITLLGQNVNSYSYRIKNLESRIWNNNSKFLLKLPSEKITFPAILDILATNFPNINFRFLTSHPKDFSEELVKTIAKHQNIAKQIHLPIQAGSDKILKAMNRPYTQKHYLSLITMTKKYIPNVKFSTDVIVGFPGETETDFQETVNVFRQVKFHEAFLNKYSPRPGTAAYKMKNDIPWEEKKRREKILRNILENEKQALN